MFSVILLIGLIALSAIFWVWGRQVDRFSVHTIEYTKQNDERLVKMTRLLGGLLERIEGLEDR